MWHKVWLLLLSKADAFNVQLERVTGDAVYLSEPGAFTICTAL